MKKIICTTLLIELSPQALPLGAACIASAIKNDQRTRQLFDVELFPFNRESPELAAFFTKNEEDKAADYISKKLAEKNPQIVCFSVYVWNRIILEKVSEKLKKIIPEVICIAGGPEVTANPVSFKNFDFTTAGQGEGSTVELLSAIEKGQTKADDFSIPGIYAKGDTLSRIDDKTVIVRSLPCLPSELSSPYLDGTLDPSLYGGALWELARGCPFKCSYCYESKGEKKIAYFPQERLEAEIELFAKKQIPQVFVLDPTYNASKERAIKMLKVIEKKAPGMFFYFEARAEFIDRELAKAFSKIPCCLQIGLQSADEQVLKNVHRTLDKKKFIKNIGYLNESGVTFGFDLIYGLPGDNFSGFCKSIDFALELYPNNLELFCLSVLPGTDLHDAAAGFGLEWETLPPYHVLKSPGFKEADLARAEALSQAVNLFYTQGRAVPWFMNVLYPLKIRPSQFFVEFEAFLRENKTLLPQDGCSSKEKTEKIIELQKKFVTKKYRQNHLDKLVNVAEDLIQINGALGLCTFDGTESEFLTSYHPDDVMSEYGCDLQFFAANCGRQKCRVKVFETPEGPDWMTV